MQEKAIQPDAPFRSGVSGKYKLLIKCVTPRFGYYDYELVDAEGKVYKATSPKNYAEGQILRSMVSLSISNARIVVTDTVICNKQDFATPVPEPPKPQQKTTPKPKSQSPNTQPYTKPKKIVLGDPQHRRTSGIYVFQVAAVELSIPGYSYRVEGAKGQQYDVQSKRLFQVGTIVDCSVTVTQSPCGILKISVSSIEEHVSIEAKQNRKHNSSRNANYSSYDWGAGPNVGDHFRLIYTPMGNKR